MPAAQLRIGAVLGLVAAIGAAAAAQSPSATIHRVDFFAVRDGGTVDDLRPDELQLLEDGVPQTIESFERVVVAPGSARSRVFVVFVDTYHTMIEDESSARLPLVRMLDRLLDRDDLVALMTPELAAGDLAFRRKAEVLSDLMQADWAWARRGRRRAPGSKEVLYDQCFDSTRAADRARGAEMKARWREETTFGALDNLVAHLGTLREERKAVLTISDGWQLFTTSRTLAEPDDDKSTRSDRLRRSGDRGSVQGSPATPVMRVECEADRRRLAMVDNSQHLRDLTEAANRANVSFYAMYTPEVTVPDEGVSRAVPQIEHAAARTDSLRLLADGTDGLAVLEADGNGRGAAAHRRRRVVVLPGDLPVDEREARWTLPDAQRPSDPSGREGADRGAAIAGSPPTSCSARAARRGRRGSAAAVPVALPDARRPFRIRTSSWAAPDGGTFWIVGELDYRTRQELEWTAGATADVVVLGADGTELAVADA